MSNEVTITVKVKNEADFKPAKEQVEQVGQKATEAGEKITQGFTRARDSLGRFVKAGQDSQDTLGGVGKAGEKASQQLDALGRLLAKLKLSPIDLQVSPKNALKAIEDTRKKLQELGRAAGTTAEVKIDTEKALAGLKKLEKGLGDVVPAGNFLENSLENISTLITNALSSAADSAKSALSNLAQGGLSMLISALAALASAVPLVAAGFAALGPALLAAGGAAGAAATAFAAAGIGLGTLMIGFGGIGDALKAHTKLMNQVGGAAQNTAEQEYQAAKRIHDAERSLTDAKMNERDAAVAVNKARQDEITRLRELNLEIEGQKASQADAAQALVEAKEKARRADQAGSDWEKANARNAVADAQARYDQITFKLNQNMEAKKKADKVGVDGSDQVQAALKRQASAHEQVIRAEEALADAHHKTATAAGASSAAATAYDQAMQNLSPNARKLVIALLALQDRFKAIKDQVQDRVLAGFDVAVTDLANKWLPHLGNILGGTADHLNMFGKALMKTLGDDTFIKNIEQAGREGEKFIDKMSVSTDAFVDAFGRLAGHSGPILQVIGKAIEHIFTWFDKWIKSADRSGKLDSFMKDAADTLQKIFDIGGKAFNVVGKFVAIIFPSSQKTGNSILDNISANLDKLSAWLDDPKNQKWIKAVADAVGEFIVLVVKKGIPAIVSMIQAFGKFIKFIGDSIRVVEKTFSALGGAIANIWNTAANKTANFFNWLSNSAHKVGNGLAGMWDGLWQGFRRAINYIIRGWNNLSFTIGGGSFLGVDLPEKTFRTFQIPYLAHGGVGNGLAVVGERGRELVRMAPGSTVIPHGQTESMIGQGGGGAARVMLGFERNSGSRLMDAIIEGLQTYVKSRGGNVQVALGRHGA